MGKLTNMFAMALVLGQLQCASWCTVSTCDLKGPNTETARMCRPAIANTVNPSKQAPARKYLHGVVAATDFLVLQTHVPNACGCYAPHRA